MLCCSEKETIHYAKYRISFMTNVIVLCGRPLFLLCSLINEPIHTATWTEVNQLCSQRKSALYGFWYAGQVLISLVEAILEWLAFGFNSPTPFSLSERRIPSFGTCLFLKNLRKILILTSTQVLNMGDSLSLKVKYCLVEAMEKIVLFSVTKKLGRQGAVLYISSFPSMRVKEYW